MSKTILMFLTTIVGHVACGGTSPPDELVQAQYDAGATLDAGHGTVAPPEFDAGSLLRIEAAGWIKPVTARNKCNPDETRLLSAIISILAHRHNVGAGHVFLSLPLLPGAVFSESNVHGPLLQADPLLTILGEQHLAICAPNLPELVDETLPTEFLLDDEFPVVGTVIYGPLIQGEVAVVAWTHPYRGGLIRFVRSSDGGWLFDADIITWIS